MSISSLSSYSDLYANNLLNSIASSASNKQNAVQDFQMPTESTDPNSNTAQVHHHGHGHHHAAPTPTTDNTSSSNSTNSQNSSQNSLAQILGTNFDFVGE